MDFKEFKKYAKQGIEILKLNGKVAEKISKDKKATNYAFLFVVLVGVAQAIGTFNVPGIIVTPIFTLIGSFIGVGILHILAKIFGGRADFMEFYRAFGIGYVGMWISVIPIIGPMLSGLLGLWYLAVNVVILKSVHKLSTAKAIIVIAIPLIIMFVLFIFLAATMVALLAGVMGNTAIGMDNFPKFI